MQKDKENVAALMREKQKKGMYLRATNFSHLFPQVEDVLTVDEHFLSRREEGCRGRREELDSRRRTALHSSMAIDE